LLKAARTSITWLNKYLLLQHSLLVRIRGKSVSEWYPDRALAGQGTL